MVIRRGSLIVLEQCNNGQIWAHLEVQKLTHSLLRIAKQETKRFARELNYPLIFCCVPENKYKLATSWGFRLSRKIEQNGEVQNVMTLESRTC